jgi:hypothetical protein
MASVGVMTIPSPYYNTTRAVIFQRQNGALTCGAAEHRGPLPRLPRRRQVKRGVR